MTAYDRLYDFALRESLRCRRPAVARFQHPWLAPMPLTAEGEMFIRARAGDAASGIGYQDVFNSGDYSLGLFHHDASEASIELVKHPAFLEAAAGSLLNFLDCMRPDGLVHRVELCHKAHEKEPSKPVMAQFALRIADAMADSGAGWLIEHDVFDRLATYITFTETHYGGMHGLTLAHSALQTGFDNDLLTVGIPDAQVEDPGASAFMVLEYEAMATLADRLGRSADAGHHRDRAEHLRMLMNELMWYEDDRGGFYVALLWKGGCAHLGDEVIGEVMAGHFEPMHTWVSLLPLYAGVPDTHRADAICRMLLDESRYWGPQGVRTLSADNRYYAQAPRVLIYDHKAGTRTPVSNWAGPVWVLSNYYMAQGLDRYGYRAEAQTLARRTADMLLRSLDEQGGMHECYNDDGLGLWPAEGGFVSWNVLALTMLREFCPDETTHWEPFEG
jgi:putative isomerase